MKKNSYQVLHCHTTFSDGTLSYREVLDKCQEYDIGTVAFTDHDILIPEEKFKELTALKHPVRFISGIEFSATGIPEVEGEIPSLHIIGLFVDHKNKALKDYCDIAKTKRRERITILVDKLNKAGFSVTEEDVEKESLDGTFGRPHIVRAVLAKNENFAVIERALMALKKKAEDDPTLLEKYEEVKSHDRNQQMFDLFLGDKPFVPDIYTPSLRQVPLDFGVKLIRDAGGIAILAHPSYYRDKIGVDLIEKLAKEGRIDGIETVFAMSPDGILGDEFREDMNAYRDINERYGLASGGGGDFHTPEDFVKINLPANRERMEETKTFLARIFAKWPEYKNKIY